MLRLSKIGLVLTLLFVPYLPAAAQTADEINRIIRSLAPITGQTIAGGSADALRAPAPRTGPMAPGVLLEVPRGQRILLVDTAHALDFDIYFPFDSADLTPRAIAELAALGQALSSPELRPHSYLIAGHTDAVGQAAYNQALSERRAKAVMRYLVEAFPIAPDRLFTFGFGQTRLKAPHDPRAAINRRVEVLLIPRP